jgi:asparagine synthase (glutamine-hydrolysing)
MCGINGFNWKDSKRINEMNKAIKHRGPDDYGFFTSTNLSLGQVRLSIIDLSHKGHQPMFYSKEKGACSNKLNKNNINYSKLSIVYNGEIYNFQDIKKNLTKKGYKFTTKTDTEVILASYLEWGYDCVNHFNGMWAFSIYDKDKNILFCSRDRLGVKPFYYYFKDDKFIFSSELKGILKHKKLNNKLNIDSVKLYFSLGFIPAPLTIFNNVSKLEAGHYLVFDFVKKKLKKSCYWEIPDYKPTYNKKKLISDCRKLLFDSTKIRMISDVPVGAFLSGGLDSSSVVGSMSKFTELKNLNTFSIGFEGRYDETKYINLVKDYYKTQHHHYYFKKNDFESLINKYSIMYDEPFADYSGFPTYKVSELAKKQVKVVLTGDGGDEIFGGYSSHLMGARLNLLKKIPKSLRWLMSKIPAKKNLNGLVSFYLLKKAFKVSLYDKEDFYAEALSEDSYKPDIYKKLTKEKLKYALKKGNNNLSEAFRIYDLLFNTLDNNFLVKVDRASMNAPIEARSPFLDYRFAEFSQKIPTSYKTTLFNTKVIMRSIIKNLVPNEIINRGKQGFEPPLDRWILEQKHEKDLKKGLELLKDIDEELYDFYLNKVFKEKENFFYNIYKIRLFLFVKWCEKWL